MGDIGVVHLVRKANGVAPLERFLTSYRQYAAGLEHTLILVLKGFSDRGLPAEYRQALDGVRHYALYLPDRGFDLEPYFAAVRRHDCTTFCFLNSFSRIGTEFWLAKLHRAAMEPGVGLVGATGSYQSFARAHDERRAQLRGLNPYARLRCRLEHIFSDRAPRMVAQRAGAWLLGAAGLWKPSRHFPPFPNYHVRTNAFMAPRNVLLRIRLRPLFFKLSAFLMESGRDGLTRQIMAMGLQPMIVDRLGRWFVKEEWHRSNTFRQSRQEDLMVEDNQTDAYAQADEVQRASLSRSAWGEYARPG
jgi:hypothetical protein